MLCPGGEPIGPALLTRSRLSLRATAGLVRHSEAFCSVRTVRYPLAAPASRSRVAECQCHANARLALNSQVCFPRHRILLVCNRSGSWSQVYHDGRVIFGRTRGSFLCPDIRKYF